MENGKSVVRIAATGDLHCTEQHRGQLTPFFEQIAQSADILCLCGDLTDYGLPVERICSRELAVANPGAGRAGKSRLRVRPR